VRSPAPLAAEALRIADLQASGDVASGPRRSPTVRAYFERVRRDDPQREKITLVATAHYLVRVMWALLKHGATWEEGHTAADGPNEHARPVANTSICSTTCVEKIGLGRAVPSSGIGPRERR
jgi:hypothetical protein